MKHCSLPLLLLLKNNSISQAKLDKDGLKKLVSNNDTIISNATGLAVEPMIADDKTTQLLMEPLIEENKRLNWCLTPILHCRLPSAILFIAGREITTLMTGL